MASVETKRRKGESFEALMRRFSRRVTSSGNLLQSRKIRFYKIKPNKNKVRKSALRGLKIQNQREWLIKTGRLLENNFGQGRGGRR